MRKTLHLESDKLPKRQKLILKEVIESYIKHPNAVGSKFLQQQTFQGVSSATIRNDLARLEKLGYLSKTHTSSGRVPTKLGYQYYVDYIITKNVEDQPPQLSQVQARMSKIFDNRKELIDKIIDQTAEFITSFLELPVVVTRAHDSHELLRKIDIVNINKKRFMIYIITSYSSFLKYYIEIDNPHQAQDIEACVRIFNEGLVDVPISEVTAKIKLLTTKIRASVHEYEFVFQKIIIRVIKELEEKAQTVKRVYNIKSLVNKPEVQKNSIDLKEVLDFLENNSVFKQINFNYQKSGKTLINFNNVVEGISVASTAIEDGGVQHKISVVGPTRMDYKLVKNILEFMHEKLSEKK